jgi:hypothetical protein
VTALLLLLAVLVAMPPGVHYQGTVGTGATVWVPPGGSTPVWTNSGSAIATNTYVATTAPTITSVASGAAKVYAVFAGCGTSTPNHNTVACTAGTCGGITFAKEIEVVSANCRASIWSGVTTTMTGATVTFTGGSSADGYLALIGVTGASANAGATGTSNDTASPFDVSVTVPGGRSANSLMLAGGIGFNDQALSAGTATTIVHQATDTNGDRGWMSRYSTDQGAGTYTLSVTGGSSFNQAAIVAVEIQAQ